MEEGIEFLHDRGLHDLSEEGILLGQLLGTEVLPTARGPLVVVEEVDEGGVGRLGKQLLVDICEEPREGRGRPSERPNMEQTAPPRELPDRPGQAGEGWVGEQSGDSRRSPRVYVRSLFSSPSALGRSVLLSAQSQQPSQRDTHSPSRQLYLSLETFFFFFSSTFDPSRLEERRTGAGKKAKPGGSG